MGKNTIFIFLVLLCFFCLTGCGAAEKEESTWQGVMPGMEDLSAITDRTEYYDIFVDSEELFLHGFWEQNPQGQYAGNVLAEGGTVHVPLGTQFHQGEPVQLWAEARPKDSDIYLYRKDGSSELLLQGISTQYTNPRNRYRWHMDQEGNFYCYRNANYSYDNPNEIQEEYREDGSLFKILSTGEILYEGNQFNASISIQDFCLLKNGSIYVLLKDYTENLWRVAELDPATGQFRPEDRLQVAMEIMTPGIGSAGDVLAMLEHGATGAGSGIVKWNPSDGSRNQVLSFTGTSYTLRNDMKLQDIQVLEDGSVEFLWTDFGESAGLLERLQMARVGKAPVVIRGNFHTDTWITERVARFNQKSDTYHVILEDCGSGNDVEDFARLTSIQVAAGKGPDILCGDELLKDYIVGMLEKGALEELNSYMESSNIREEDYFPATFSTWRVGEHIYGINPRLNIVGARMDVEILGSAEVPDIEALVDALLSQKGDGVLYTGGADAGRVLWSFLEGTDSLWGMVDWEKGTCDFDTPLFGKLLEAARRFGDNGRKQPETDITESRWFHDIFRYDSLAEQESAGKVSCGILFDDGCYGAIRSTFTMAINANATQKEGAWEFLRFLLGMEVQNADSATPPVNREAFEQWLQRNIEQGSNLITQEGVFCYTKEDITAEKQAEYRKALEEARPFPIRTVPILNMIQEEAAEYFSGAKSVEEVSRVVTNRVQLYLDERK